MTDAMPKPEVANQRSRDPVRTTLMACAVYFCFVGIALLVLDLVNWRIVGTYQSPSLLGMLVLKWLAVPGIALAGGAAMVAGSCRPARPWGFLVAMLMLLIFVWCWDMSDFLTSLP
jgi:hypothetical protein